MNSQYHHCNFFVSSVSSSDIDVMKRLPSFFSSLEYTESESGLYVILYRSDLDYKKCMNQYLEDKISQTEQEFERFDNYRKDLSKQITKSIVSICSDYFEDQRIYFIDSVIQMYKSKFDEQKDTLFDDLNNLVSN